MVVMDPVIDKLMCNVNRQNSSKDEYVDPIKIMKTNDINECIEKCESNTDCKYATFNTKPNLNPNCIHNDYNCITREINSLEDIPQVNHGKDITMKAKKTHMFRDDVTYTWHKDDSKMEDIVSVLEILSDLTRNFVHNPPLNLKTATLGLITISCSPSSERKPGVKIDWTIPSFLELSVATSFMFSSKI